MRGRGPRMKPFEGLRVLARKRAVVVVAVFAAVALSVGAGAVLAGATGSGIGVRVNGPVPRAPLAPNAKLGANVTVGHSYHNDTSLPLRVLPAKPLVSGREMEASPNPRPVSEHKDARDAVRQAKQFAPNMPAATLNFDGIVFPGVDCNCAPPDTNGEVGATQYVQMVNTGLQVFNKATGASVLGPVGISTVWNGFGGPCETAGDGDPVVLYDQLANRWVISQFAGADVPTDECIAVSTTSDATGSWHRYGFHLGTDFFDYPHVGVWPDAYYMSMNVFNSTGSAFLGPQPFAFNRAAMLAGMTATFVTTRAAAVFSPSNDAMLPGDLDGSTAPPAAAPAPFLMSGTAATWKLFRYHVDFATPGNSTFTLGGNLTPAGYTELCPSTRSCVPQLGTNDGLDGIGDRGMFRLAYRKFGDGHEALVGNQTVSSGGVAGIRWYEIGNATSGAPAFTQQNTYQPDTTWRWMGSAAMDRDGDLALGYSASSAAIYPQIRYAGRLAGDPASTLAQGEATLFAGTGSQTGTGNRWGDYSDLTVDPVDDCTFWYTNEYYPVDPGPPSGNEFNWRTRIGTFKFPSCNNPNAFLTIGKSADAASVDAGSQAGFTVTLSNVGGQNATGIAVTDNLPSGTGVDWSVDAGGSSAGWSVTGSPPSQQLVWGQTSLAAGASTHVHVVSSTTAGTCGATLSNTASFTSGNGGSDSVSASVAVLGALTMALSQSFDGVTAPALSAGWTATNATGAAPLWTTSSSGTPTPSADSAPNAAFVNDPATVSDKRLDSPTIAVPGALPVLTFRQNRNLESTYDGGVLELSIDGGPFQDIVAAGGTFAGGGYN